jgi:hypothetical protein
MIRMVWPISNCNLGQTPYHLFRTRKVGALVTKYFPTTKFRFLQEEVLVHIRFSVDARKFLLANCRVPVRKVHFGVLL